MRMYMMPQMPHMYSCTYQWLNVNMQDIIWQHVGAVQ